MPGPGMAAFNVFSKDKSWVNKIIFPAPNPPLYDADHFGTDARRGRLIYIPRRQAAVRRTTKVHDPNSVPCLLYECGHPGSDKILLYCHGNSEDIGNTAGVLRRLRDTLHMHVMAIEYPGYGISPGEPSETGLNNDVLVVYSFVVGALRWQPKDIILFGYSIGTGPTTHLAAHKDVGALVLCAPYTSIRDMVECILPKVGKVAQYLISNRFVNKDEIKAVTAPTLIIHGKADRLIPASHSEELYKNCGSKKKQLYLADTLDHCYTDDDFEAYILFPLLTFLEAKRMAGRYMRLPEYVLAHPNTAVVEASKLAAAGVSSSSSVDETEAQAEKDKEEEKQEDEQQEWACLVCTFVNPGFEPTCLMCGKPKPKAIVQWQCGVCTYLNLYREDACEVCATSNPAMKRKVDPPAVSVDVGKGPKDESNTGSGQRAASPRSKSSSGAVSPPSSPTSPQGPVSLYERALANGPIGINPRGSSSDAASAGTWACPLCTLVNTGPQPRCVACGTPKG